MSQESNFEVFWDDISYKVSPFISLNDVCDSFSRSTQQCINSLFESNKKYELNSASIKEAITILHNVSGSFRSGELTAVMGPSGSGKTSLLNLIARRKTKGYCGRYLMKGSRRQVGISTIPQKDHLPQYLTVRENLLFASRLKNMVKDFDHEGVVAGIVSVLNLGRCADTMTNQISAGQQKRVSIAQELVSKPDILILDEPTSGLDSLTCYKTLEFLKKLVKMPTDNPIAIVLTIHQPEHDVFNIFDKVYALAPGGVAIYNGPPKECSEYIMKHTGLKMSHADYNPASFLIEIAGNEYGQGPIEVLKRQVKVDCANQETSLFPMSGRKAINNETNNLGFRSIETKLEIASPTATLDIDKRLKTGSSIDSGHFWRKTLILSHRYYVSLIRDPKQLLASLLVHLLLPFVVSVILGKEASRANSCPRMIGSIGLRELAMDEQLASEDIPNELEQCMENSATLFVFAHTIHAVNAGTVALSFTLDMLSSLKEYHNSWYSINSYILARIITDIPFTVIMPAVCTSFMFYMTGQAISGGLSFVERAMIASLSVVMGSVVARALGMIFASIFLGQIFTSLFATQAAFAPPSLVNGFFTRPKNMKPHIFMIAQASLTKHTMDLLMLARYGFNTCECQPGSVKQAEITGVSNQLKEFTQYYLSEMGGGQNSSTGVMNGTMTDAKDDLFRLFAEQISLFNTNGRKVIDCRQVQPHVLYEESLNDEDLVPILMKFSLLVLSTILVLFVTVKFVVRQKTSL